MNRTIACHAASVPLPVASHVMIGPHGPNIASAKIAANEPASKHAMTPTPRKNVAMMYLMSEWDIVVEVIRLRFACCRLRRARARLATFLATAQQLELVSNDLGGVAL